MTASASKLRGAALSWLVLLKQLPGFAPFLPLIWASVSGQAAPPTNGAAPPAGELTPAERDWLAAQARRTPQAGVIVQAGPPQADVTCALAAGCWGSGRRVHALWPEAAAASEDFRHWHQTIIQQGLAPYVTPITTSEPWSGPADLVYAVDSQVWAERAGPGTVVVIRGPAQPSSLVAEQVDICGALIALRVGPGQPGQRAAK